MKKVILLFFLISMGCFAQQSIETKFSPPEGYERIYHDGYAQFLRQFPLKDNNVVNRSEERFSRNAETVQ